MGREAGEPRILAFDTSSSRCVVGVTRGEEVLGAVVDLSPAAPSEGLLPLVHGCLEESRLGLAELDALVVGRGPGSFTGTRIALSTAKGIALGAGIPVVAVSSLEAAALDAGWTHGPVVVALDARKGELLVSAYACSVTSLQTLLEPSLLEPGHVADRLRALGEDIRVVGDGPLRHPGAFPGHLEIAPASAPLISSPLPLVRLALPRLARGETDGPDALEPLYSRPPPVHGARGPSEAN